MIKDSFKLKKKSWHMYLMEFLWGLNHTNFPNMCPYFWLSVANVIISPIAVPIWSIIKLIRISVKNYKEYLENKELEAKQLRILRYKELLKKQQFTKELRNAARYTFTYAANDTKERIARRDYHEICINLRGKELEAFRLLIEREEKLHEIENLENNAKYQKEREDERRKYALKEEYKQQQRHKEFQKQCERAKKVAKRRDRIAKFKKLFSPVKLEHAVKQRLIGKFTVIIKKVAKIFKWIVIVVASILLLACLIELISLAIENYSYEKAKFIFRILSLAVIIFVIGLSLIKLISKAIHYFKYHQINTTWIRTTVKYIGYLFYPIKLIWVLIKKIGKKCKELWEFLLALKADNCPAIDWE